MTTGTFPQGNEIAIVGMSVRTPGARNLDQFWEIISQGKASLRRYSEDELRRAGVPDSLISDPDYVPAGGPLEGMEEFDAAFFGFSEEDAALTDPQHRHFLECAWEALEHACHPPSRSGASVGVFAGCGMNAYFMFNLVANPELLRSKGLFLLRHTGNDRDFLPTSVSYRLNLRGPSIAVQSACSSSLVAVHMGVQSLLAGECDIALAGGAHILVPHGQGYLYRANEVLSPDGRCFAFDSRASGTVISSGVAVLALRRLDDAIRDGDHIHAIIRGSAINNDGAAKAGFFAPSVDGHAQVISEAQSLADLAGDDIGYMEVPGMGTPIGDPIVIAALTKAFRRTTQRNGFCRVGSMEPVIGHLDVASGAVALIKAVLALHHRKIPPNLNFSTANPAIDFSTTPFVVNTRLEDWTTSGTPRRAGVSALGIGGTNAHVVIEEAPSPRPSDPPGSEELLILSAKTAGSLHASMQSLAAHLQREPNTHLGDLAFTLQEGRESFTHRWAAVVSDVTGAIERLRSDETGQASSRQVDSSDPEIIFAFPATDPPIASARAMAAKFPLVRETLAAAFDALPGIVSPDWMERWMRGQHSGFPDKAQGVFRIAYQIAVARLYISWGIRPHVVLGSLSGEYAAAHLAGFLSLPDAVGLAASGDAPATISATQVATQAPPIRVVSCATGKVVGATARHNSRFWHQAARGPSQIAAALREAIRSKHSVVLDFGTGNDFSMHGEVMEPAPSYMRAVLESTNLTTSALGFLGRLWVTGAAVDMSALRRARHRKRPLGAEPFPLVVEAAHLGRVDLNRKNHRAARNGQPLCPVCGWLDQTRFALHGGPWTRAICMENECRGATIDPCLNLRALLDRNPNPRHTAHIS